MNEPLNGKRSPFTVENARRVHGRDIVSPQPVYDLPEFIAWIPPGGMPVIGESLEEIERHAREWASENPGKTIVVYRAVGIATVPVAPAEFIRLEDGSAPPQITMTYPPEDKNFVPKVPAGGLVLAPMALTARQDRLRERFEADCCRDMGATAFNGWLACLADDEREAWEALPDSDPAKWPS